MTSTAIGQNIETAKSHWYLINAENQVLGRLASTIATILMGKHRPSFTRHLLSGSQVVVINADKIKFTGTKLQTKIYKSFSGYPGGLKEMNLERLLKKDVTRPLEKAVQGMLPKSGLGNRMLKRLHVYAGTEHPHQAHALQEYTDISSMKIQTAKSPKGSQDKK